MMQLSIAVLFLVLGVVVTQDPLATRRNINLVLVNDNSLYRNFFGSDERRVRDFNKKVVQWMNKVYNQINIHVTLMHSEIWKDGDKIQGKNLGDYLDKFKKWAPDNMYRRYRYHSMHIITGNKNLGGLGVAYMSQVCRPSSVGANNYAVDHVQRMKDPVEYMGIVVAVSGVVSSSALLISFYSSTKWATTSACLTPTTFPVLASATRSPANVT